MHHDESGDGHTWAASPASGRPPAPPSRTRACIECGALVTATGSRGPVPSRCAPCRRENANRRSREYSRRHPDRRAAAARRYYRKPGVREAKVAYNRRHRQENPELWAAHYARRRAAKRAPGAELIVRTEVAQRDGWLCGLCFTSIDPEAVYPDPLSLSIDHVVPLARGGEHTWENVRATHLRCNCRRGVRLLAIDAECLPTPEQIERMYEKHIEHMFESDEEAA